MVAGRGKQWLHVARHVLLVSCMRDVLRLLRYSVQEAGSRLPEATMEWLEAWQEDAFSKVQLDGGPSFGRRIPRKAGLDQ